jgi:type 1 glutamine amidotransferase
VTRSLLLTGGPVHDFAATSRAVAALLEEQGLPATVVSDPGAAVDLLRAAEAGVEEPVALFAVNTLRWGMDQPGYEPLRAEHAHRIRDEDAAVLDGFVRSGGGLLALHTAVICFDGHPIWRALCGAAWVWGTSTHPPAGPVEVRVTDVGRSHAVTAGLDDFTVDDEVYGFLDEVDGLIPLLAADHGGREHPLVWARPVGRGRVVTDLLGHGPASFDHPVHRRLLLAAIAWARGDRVETPEAAP